MKIYIMYQQWGRSSLKQPILEEFENSLISVSKMLMNFWKIENSLKTCGTKQVQENVVGETPSSDSRRYRPKAFGGGTVLSQELADYGLQGTFAPLFLYGPQPKNAFYMFKVGKKISKDEY